MEGMPLNQMTWPAPRGATPALELVNKISKFAGRQCCVEGACGWICSDVESVAWGTAPSGLSHWRGHCTGTDWLSWCTSNVFFRESSSEGFHGAPSPAQGSSHEGFSTETSGASALASHRTHPGACCTMSIAVSRYLGST